MTLYYGHWVFWTLPGMTKASSHNTFIYLHLLTCLLFDYRSLDFILPDSNTLLESESFFIPVPNSDEDQTESGMLYHLQNLPINYQKPSFE